MLFIYTRHFLPILITDCFSMSLVLSIVWLVCLLTFLKSSNGCLSYITTQSAYALYGHVLPYLAISANSGSSFVCFIYLFIYLVFYLLVYIACRISNTVLSNRWLSTVHFDVFCFITVDISCNLTMDILTTYILQNHVHETCIYC